VYPGRWVDPADDPRENDVWPVGERDTLVEYLRSYRLTLEMKCADLDAEQLAAGAPSLDITGKLDGDEGREVPLRSVLVHMIEEYARHCGHTDLLRERIDGRVGQLVTEAP
jgi:hypothetical protein